MEISTGTNVNPSDLDEDGQEADTVDARPVTSEPNDWNIATLRDKAERGKIVLQPDYQREDVWKLKPELAPRLIESVLLNIPIPPIYFGKLPAGKLEVIDGQQRLTTLIRFVKNEFELSRLLKLASLNGKYFKELSEENQSKILDQSIRSVTIDSGPDSNLRYEIFERLNRGAMALNEQELRNCAYRGPFCDLLKELEASNEWRNVKRGSEPEPRFKEREMILRFFAFANRLHDYKGKLKSFLSDYMGQHAPKGEELTSQKEMFLQTMKNVWKVFGENSGRLYSEGTPDKPDCKWDPKFSISALDIQAAALMRQNPGKVQFVAEQIKELYLHYLLTEPKIRDAISRQPASSASTRLRWTGFKAEVDKIIEGTVLEPRFFSLEFRTQLYEKDSVCKFCHNKIHNLEDSTVDHIHPYSKGGKTVPENSQIMHRSCNARKSASLPVPS